MAVRGGMSRESGGGAAGAGVAALSLPVFELVISPAAGLLAGMGTVVPFRSATGTTPRGGPQKTSRLVLQRSVWV